MENLEQNYEDFISTVSHELRTPLTSIRGFAQTMLSSWDRLDDENKKKFIKIIEQQSNRLIGLVENMLTVTKLQSNKNHYVYSEFDLVPMVEETTAIIKNQYKDKIFIFKKGNNLSKIFADKDKFQQVLTNLIENSAKYSFQSNEIKISAENKDENIVLTITNIGIDSKDYDKIFTKFSRLDNPLTRTTQGSGLGLYITKNILEKMDGKIEVKSEKLNDDSGLSEITFKVTMPIKNIEEQARMKCNQ